MHFGTTPTGPPNAVDSRLPCPLNGGGCEPRHVADSAASMRSILCTADLRADWVGRQHYELRSVGTEADGQSTRGAPRGTATHGWARQGPKTCRSQPVTRRHRPDRRTKLGCTMMLGLLPSAPQQGQSAPCGVRGWFTSRFPPLAVQPAFSTSAVAMAGPQTHSEKEHDASHQSDARPYW